MFFFVSVHALEAEVEVETIEAEISTAPDVPTFISRTMPEIVEVHFEAREIVRPLADGKNYKFWSFNGTVPGPMVRVRLGDTVEFHLSNHISSQFPHNIDIHAVNGPGGGASVSLVAPGEERVFRFKTLYPGLYIYHCASPIPSIPAHIANGMYGLLLVEPKHGFPRVDHEFYIVESEFYTKVSDDEELQETKVELEQEQPNIAKEEKITVLQEIPSEPSIEKEAVEEEKSFMDIIFGDSSEPQTPEKTEEKITALGENSAESSIEKEAVEEEKSFMDIIFGESSEPQSPEKDNVQETSTKAPEDTAQIESDTSPEHEEQVLLELSLEKGLKEQPDYVVFNGSKGALLGENALRVNVGDKVRIYFGNIGPNGISSFHINGEIFDQVYLEGSANGITNRSVQTTMVPSAGATIVEFTIDVPGDYLLVDHSIFRIEKGAIGLITAVGGDDPEIFESLK